ncbi:hypothetical protein [Eupransor demetentiae]|uniref:MORN repeat protein n=1 Tax=Eupransor demetentiae TaxID=3109584 RepID=A0ABM9N6M7_9LACO|nr:hypothetical protein R54876_GBNLAHCA_01467 [Lactobacillaceae bacterium LMG 33000]
MKVILGGWFLLCLLLAAYAFQDTSRQKVNNYQLTPTIAYTGQLKDHYFAGEGELKLKNGSYYKGSFTKGRFDGQGTYHDKAGWSYSGHFKNGQADGQGTFTTAQGKRHSGTFKDGRLAS